MPLSFVHREPIRDLSIDGIKSYRLTTFSKTTHGRSPHVYSEKRWQWRLNRR